MTSLSQKVLLNTMALGGSRMLRSVFGVVSLALSARYLGLGQFGALVTASAFAAVVGGMTDLGISTIGARELASRPGESKRIVGSLLPLAFVLSTVGLVVGVALTFLIYGGQARAELREGIAVLLFIGWLLAAPGLVIGCYFTSQQKAYLAAFASFVGSVTSVVLVVVVIALDGGFLGIVLAYGFSGIGFGLTMLVLSIGRVRLRPSFDVAHMGQLFRSALPLGGAIILGALYWKIDIILLSLLGSQKDVAIYGVAFKFVDILVTLPDYVMITLLPEFARVADRRERLNEVMGKALAVVQVAVVPLVVLSLVFADEIVEAVGGAKYGGAAALVRILMLGVALAYISIVFFQGIIALRRQKLLFYASLAVVAMNIVLNLLFIPAWGARGAAIAFVSSEMATLAVLLLVYRRLAAVPRLHRFGSVIVAGAAAALVGLVKLLPLAAEVSPIVVLVLGGLVGLGVYIGTLYALDAMPRELHTAITLPVWAKLKKR